MTTNPYIEPIVEKIKAGDYKQVVILSGAGVSTNAGISDYRSRTGIFAQLANGADFPDATRPEDFFSRRFVNQHPELHDHPIVQEFRRQMLDATPTASHQLAKWFDELGILHRVFTQNVDGLYHKTGLHSDKIVEYHGNYTDGSIVLYGDPIPMRAKYRAVQDLIVNCDTDLLIVMGTSLQVSPFCALPNMVSKSCTRILVDTQPENAMINSWSKLGTPTESIYSGVGSDSSIKLGGRRVTLRPQWGKGSKYKDQYIFTADCDAWATALMEAYK